MYENCYRDDYTFLLGARLLPAQRDPLVRLSQQGNAISSVSSIFNPQLLFEQREILLPLARFTTLYV